MIKNAISKAYTDENIANDLFKQKKTKTQVMTDIDPMPVEEPTDNLSNIKDDSGRYRPPFQEISN